VIPVLLVHAGHRTVLRAGPPAICGRQRGPRELWRGPPQQQPMPSSHKHRRPEQCRSPGTPPISTRCTATTTRKVTGVGPYPYDVAFSADGALAACVLPASAAAASRTSRPGVIGYLTELMTNKLDRFDPATDRMLAPITVGRAPFAMAIAPGAGWPTSPAPTRPFGRVDGYQVPAGEHSRWALAR
jgi:hypothetical protein